MSDSNRFRGGSAAALVVILASALFTSSAAADTINFDTDANGNPLSVPSGFASTTRLTELYASLGVHFAGPGGNDGGAILHQDGNFGLAARSGTNFLAFNRTAPMADGGIPTDPETITFDNPMSVVSIYAAGGHTTDSFLMEAYDASNVLVAS